MLKSLGGIKGCKYKSCLKKNQNAPRPSLNIPHHSQGGKNVKTFRCWDQRLQIQNLFMAFKRVPQWKQLWVNSIMSGRSPPLYCELTLIAMQGHNKNSKNKIETIIMYVVCSTPSHMAWVVIMVIIYHYIGYKYKATTYRRKKVGEKSCVTFLLCDPGWYVQRT